MQDDPNGAHRLILAAHREHAGPLTAAETLALDQLAADACGTQQARDQLQVAAALVVGMARGTAWHGSSTTRKADLRAAAKNLERFVRSLGRLDLRTLLAAIASDDPAPSTPDQLANGSASGPTGSPLARAAEFTMVLARLGEIERALLRLAEG